MLEKAKRNREKKELVDLTNFRIKLLESVKNILLNCIYLVRLPEKLEAGFWTGELSQVLGSWGGGELSLIQLSIKGNIQNTVFHEENSPITMNK